MWNVGLQRLRLREGEQLRNNLQKIAMFLMALMLAICLGFVVQQENDYRKGALDYSTAKGISGFPQHITSTVPEQVEEENCEDTYAVQLASMDLEVLRATNCDVVGWLDIPDTELSYPLLQGQDNHYYLKHTWKGTLSSVGSIFMDYKVSSNFDEFNTIIYGHRMRNETMFGSLKHYKKINYWEEHPSIYVILDHCVCRYDIYAAYEPRIEEITFGLEIRNQDAKEAMIQLGMEKSVIDTGIKPKTEDRILTLSTCTGKGYSSRWVVQAVLTEVLSIG